MAKALGLGVARRLGEVTAAPRLGMRRQGRGQLVFKAQGALGYTARRRCVGGANFGVATVVIEAETREKKNSVANMWGWLAAAQGAEGENCTGAAADGPAC